ncbi:hypothetical protein OKW27_003080 [Paraburkholderia sp. 35.1]
MSAKEDREYGSARSGYHGVVGEDTASEVEPLLEDLILAHGPEESSGTNSSSIRSPVIAFTLPQMAVATNSTALVSLRRSFDESGADFMNDRCVTSEFRRLELAASRHSRCMIAGGLCQINLCLLPICECSAPMDPAPGAYPDDRIWPRSGRACLAQPPVRQFAQTQRICHEQLHCTDVARQRSPQSGPSEIQYYMPIYL